MDGWMDDHGDGDGDDDGGGGDDDDLKFVVEGLLHASYYSVLLESMVL